MRFDMSKVLVERERLGVEGAEKHRRRNRRIANRSVRADIIKNINARYADEVLDHDTGATKVSMGRHRQYGWEAKQLNENLSPLKRFIASNVGRVWDKVYSEIRAHVRFENTVQQHIMQHLWQYVERNPILNDEGVACYPPPHFRSWRGGLTPIGYDSFFVHPTTGILSRGKKTKSKPRNHAPSSAGVKRQVGQSGFEEVQVKKGGNVFIKDGGVWYLADMRPVPEEYGWGKPVRRTRQERHYDPIKGVTVVEVPFNDEGPKDVLLGRRVGYRQESRFVRGDLTRFVVAEVQRYYGRTDRYCAGKGHQLDTKALRRLGLKND